METALPKARFLTKVMLPIAAAFLVTVLAVASFIAVAINSVDTDALEHQRRLVNEALSATIHDAIHGQKDLTAWDELVQAIKEDDFAWITKNLASYTDEHLGQDQTFILNEREEAIYAARHGESVSPERFESVRAIVTPLLRQLQSPQNMSDLASYRGGSRDIVLHAHDLGVIDGMPAIIMVSPVVSDSRRLNGIDGSEPILVGITLLGPTQGRDLAEQYLLRNPHFSERPDWSVPEAVFPLRNAAGETVTFLKWLPDRPGRRILDDTLPALGIALLVAGLIIALLLRNLRQASRQLLAERADAHHRAMHDPLTGLGNRALFDVSLSEALKDMTARGSRVSLLFLDLDSFKPVNDTFGHKAGDDLLRQVGRRITGQLAPRDTLVRMGGDEFAIIQPCGAGNAQSADLAACVIAAINQPFDVLGNAVSIGISIGIATAPDKARSGIDLMGRADIALYRAKAGGRNRYCFFNDSSPGSPADLADGLQSAFEHRGAA